MRYCAGEGNKMDSARQVTEFLDYARKRPGVSFRFAEGASGEGISISCWAR
jgi:hypothetical protein